MSTLQNIFLSSFSIFFIISTHLLNIAQAMIIPLPSADSKLYIEQNADNVPNIAQYQASEDHENNFAHSPIAQSPKSLETLRANSPEGQNLYSPQNQSTNLESENLPSHRATHESQTQIQNMSTAAPEYLVPSLSKSKTDCTNDTSICSRYCRVSEALSCPKTNYLMNFGYKYCRIFLENENLFTRNGKIVFQNIRSCLIKTLTEKIDLTCANVKTVASRSHRTCYLKNGFCELSAWDKFIVYWYAMPELTDPLFRKTKDQISRACFKR
jgi:hypothetical protein